MTLDDEIINEIDKGRKLSAIKMVREKSGMGLAQAKAVVDNQKHPGHARYN